MPDQITETVPEPEFHAARKSPPRDVSDAPGRPPHVKGDNHRLEAPIMMASEPAWNVDA
jgi:hypothetical protein